MRKVDLEIRFSWKKRINDHDIPNYTLYKNGKEVYSCQYKNYVVDYINENYAKKRNAKLKNKLKLLSNKDNLLYIQMSKIQKELNRPMVKTRGV